MDISKLIFTHTVQCIVDQQSPEVERTTAKFGLVGAPCGFLALATLFAETLDETTILRCLEHDILPWTITRREAYADAHSHEFAPNGASWKESAGRMNRASYLTTIASAAEIALCIHKHTTPGGWNVAFLRNVYEGPPVSDESIRMPRGDFTSDEDAQYLGEEKPFHGHDYYIQVKGRRLVTVKDFVQEVKVSRGEWRIVMDECGHFVVVRVIIQENRQILLEKLDTLKRSKGAPSSPCVCFLVDHLKEAFGYE